MKGFTDKSRLGRAVVNQLLVYVDGLYVPAEKASVSVFDHGFLYGDGVFEGIAVYKSRAFMLEHHLTRFFRSARTLGLKIPLTRKQLRLAVNETIAKNGILDGYVRPIVTRGRGPLGLNPDHCREPTMMIIPQRASDYPPMSIRKPSKAIISTFRRNPHFSIPASAKTLNYVNNILAKQQANAAGVDEAIMLDWTGKISEGTGDNIFLIRDGHVYTPSSRNSILLGVTRLAVLRICKAHGIPFTESELVPRDLYEADEAFLTSTSLEILPLIEVDHRRIGSGKEGTLTLRLRGYFDKLKMRDEA